MAFDLGVKAGQAIKGGWPGEHQIKAIGEEARTIDFVFSDETLDRDHEIIRASGWKLENYRLNPVFLFAHEHWEVPIGKSLQTWIAETSLMGRVKFAAAENGNEAGEAFFRLYRDGFMNTVSVGFQGIRCEYPAEYGQMLPSGARCEFVEQDLLECSAVPVPANPSAGIIRSLEPGMTDEIRRELAGMKSKGIVHEATLKAITSAYDRLERRKSLWFPVRECKHEEPCENVRSRGECEYHRSSKSMGVSMVQEKKVSGKKSLPLAPTDTAWSASAARKRIAKWASSDGSGDKDKIDWAKFGQGHVVLRDEEAPENMGSYALPFADVIADKLTAIPRGIFAAGAVMDGARGGIELSDPDRTAAKAFLKSYYTAMNLTPPWEESRGAYNLEDWERKELARIFLEDEWSREPVMATFARSMEGLSERKDGQVLNARNRELITVVHKAMHEMMNSAGMDHPPMDGSEPENAPENDPENDPDDDLVSEGVEADIRKTLAAALLHDGGNEGGYLLDLLEEILET